MQWLLLLGIATGMRAMTAIAVVCWFAYLRLTPLHGWAFWAGYLASVIVFTLFALGEYVGDTLPHTPNRTAAGPAVARLVFGALVGALVCNATHEPVAGGILLGSIGAALGTWGGFRMRARLAARFGRDLPAALLESVVAVAISIWAAHQIALAVAIASKWWV